MKLTNEMKAVYADKLLAMSYACFSGIEVPPRAEFLRHLQEDDVFVNCADDIVAYAIVEHRPGRAYIWQIATKEEYRGLGHARWLLAEIRNYYQPTETQIDLTVKQDNVDAQILYLKSGYLVVAMLKDYYEPQTDGLRMRLVL